MNKVYDELLGIDTTLYFLEEALAATLENDKQLDKTLLHDIVERLRVKVQQIAALSEQA